MSFRSTLNNTSPNTGDIRQTHNSENGSDQGMHDGGVDDDEQLNPQISKRCNDNEHYITTFESYSRMLDGFERYRESATNRSYEAAAVNTRRDATSWLHEPEDTQEDPSGPSKWAQSPQPDDDDSKHPLKRRVDISVFPWANADSGESSSIPESLKLTQAALQNFARNLKFTKSNVVNSIKCPQFPDSEWKNLLAGKAVDLDHLGFLG